MLSDSGYATAIFGKWHLGDTEGRYPTDQGFDEWYGIPNSTDESAWTVLNGFDKAGLEKTYVMEAKKGEEPKGSKYVPATEESKASRKTPAENVRPSNQALIYSAGIDLIKEKRKKRDERVNELEELCNTYNQQFL